MESVHLYCEEIGEGHQGKFVVQACFTALDLDSSAEIWSHEETTTGHSQSNCSFSCGTVVTGC